jgi:AcrR family transcriptional regulator
MSIPLADQRARPRKMPKQARSLATWEAIVEAAARILETRGHGGFSTNAVADLAGVSIGSLYQYFPEKDALIGALIVRETVLLIEEARIATQTPSGAGALSGLIRACVAHQLRRPALARLLDYEEARMPQDVDVCEAKNQFRGLLLVALERADLPRQSYPATAAQDVMAIIKGMVDTAGEHGETNQQWLAERVERAVCGYVMGRS